MNENLDYTGWVKHQCYDASGKLKWEFEDHNLVVTAGKNYLATGAGLEDFAYVAIGSGSTAPVVGNTAMETETARVAGTPSSSLNVFQNQASFGPGVGTGSYREAGLLTASSGGTLLARQTFTGGIKDANDTLVITWSITVA